MGTEFDEYELFVDRTFSFLQHSTHARPLCAADMTF